MGLRESRIINSVHPWLGARLKWLGEVARIVGSSQQLISGNRTQAEQTKLFNTVFDRPVAAPGCSQHQYGFAADAQYFRATGITSKGRGIVASQNETDRFFQSAANHVGLTTVNNDPGHLQIYPGAQFRSWAVARGLCPPVRPPTIKRFGIIQEICGLGAVSVQREPLFGQITCEKPSGNFFILDV